MAWNLPSAVGGQGRRRRRRGLTTVAVGFVVTILGVGAAAAASVSGVFGQQHVGATDSRGILLPSNQRIAPLGTRLLINNGRLLSSALSPDGRYVAALSWENFDGFVSIFDVKTNRVVQQIGTGTTTDPALGDTTVAADGPLWSPDGKTLWVSQTSDVLRFSVTDNGTLSRKPVVIPMLDASGPYLPSGLALSPDGSKLYAALNGANTLGVIDTGSNTLVDQIKVGVAPRQVALVGSNAYVSNEGGRPAKPGDTTNLSDNTPVVSDPVTGAAVSGTVSVVDLNRQKQTTTIAVGLQPTAFYRSGTALFVANSNDDSVSIIDTTKNIVAQTINVNPLPGSTVGSYPNAISMPDSNHILVSIGRDNAIAAYTYNGLNQPVQYDGLIPTDWYPVNVEYSSALKKVIVTNDRGIGARGPASTVTEGPDANPATGHNTYDDTGSLTSFSPPTEADLSGLTHRVFVNNDWENLLQSAPSTSKAAPVAVPVKLGDPSTIKHVFLIVKENRTYDQVLGDLGKGNGDPTLTQFGASVTPNQHALANRYAAFDNFYDEGTLSADGHNWLMQADANDYIEREFGAFYRSYPAQGGDALAYQRDGFLWNAAAKAGKTSAAFGEYNNYFTVDTAAKPPTWSQWYQDALILEHKGAGPLPIPVNKYRTYSDIPSLNAITDHSYPRFDTDVPDQYRVDIWQKAFAKAEKANTLANLNLLWVPDDHTAGTSGADPFPTAQVADNDLAVGRIVDTISHSKDWKDSAIFVLEDDSQAGVDHVDGHRAPLYLISPYANRATVNSTYYSQLNVVKTIEQILGIAPMNQMDRAAEPMTNAFTNTANDQPFVALPNQIPLTFGLNTAAATKNASAKQTSASTAQVPAAQLGIFAQWQLWSRHQQFGGSKPDEDRSNPAQLNRLDWYASTGWKRPYPGDAKILGPYQVPGWDRPAADLGG